jgi:hypothetical protein
LDKNRKITLALLLGGLVVVFLVSCGDEGGTGLPCNNCDFWAKAFGDTGAFKDATRFPAASPVDAQLLALSSKRYGQHTSPEYHIWVVRVDPESHRTWPYQITFDEYNDFNPAWSPDGEKIAFQRNIGAGDQWQIYVVDVSDLEAPGLPQAITSTDSTDIPYSNRWPSWVTLGDETWICFCNTPLGSGDADMAVIRYPELGEPDTISIDPSDFARYEAGVMSSTFDDEFPSSNGTNMIAFSSPNRVPVVDIDVIARSEEQPGNDAVAEIFVNQKDSGVTTPHRFRYRPVPTTVLIEGSMDTYCIDHQGTISSATDSVYTYLIDFVHTHGTIGIRSNPGNRWIYFNDDPDSCGPTSDVVDEYIYFTCMLADTYHIWTKDYYQNEPCCSTGADCCSLDASTIVEPESYYVEHCRTVIDDTSDPPDTTYLNCVIVAPGETTFVSFNCQHGEAYSGRVQAASGSRGAPRTGCLSGSPTGPTAMQENARSVWLLDAGEEPGTDDDKMYFVDGADVGLYYPTLSADGKYLAYVRGEGTSWDVVVRDVSGIASGTIGPRRVIGLPGSKEDIECWRGIERISWLPTGAGRKLAASISVCRGGSPEQYEVWIADLSGFLD